MIYKKQGHQKDGLVFYKKNKINYLIDIIVNFCYSE